MRFVLDIWQILDSRQRRWILVAQLASLTMALSTVAGVAAISPFFVVLGEPRLIVANPLLHWLYRHGDFQSQRGFIMALGFGFAGMVMLTNCIHLAGRYLLERIALRIGDDIRLRLFKDYLHRGLAFHAVVHSATLASNVAYETERGIVTTLESLFELITALVTTAVILVSIAWVNPIVAGTIVCALVGGYATIYLAVRRRMLQAGRTKRELEAHRMKVIMESFGALHEMTVLGRQRYFQTRFEKSTRGISELTAHIHAVTHSPKYVMESLAVAGLLGVALALSASDAGVGQWLGRLTFLSFAVYRLLPALQQAFTGFVRIRAAAVSFANIADDLRQGSGEFVTSVVRSVPPTGKSPFIVRLSHVCFTYPNAPEPALLDISLDIVAGSVTGLIGANGSGKTTLVDVIAGLLVPQSGCVVLHGRALDEHTQGPWRSPVAYVPQSVFLLDATVAENIAFGVEPDAIDRERMMMAARLATLEDFVRGLPGGFEERIGERGARLSGGQRQRIGIARALYANASVLILDEATNALDEPTALEIMRTIQGLRGDRTIILIAHGFDTLRECDFIVELDRGSVARTGSWQDLANASTHPGASAGVSCGTGRVRTL